MEHRAPACPLPPPAAVAHMQHQLPQAANASDSPAMENAAHGCPPHPSSPDVANLQQHHLSQVTNTSDCAVVELRAHGWPHPPPADVAYLQQHHLSQVRTASDCHVKDFRTKIYPHPQPSDVAHLQLQLSQEFPKAPSTDKTSDQQPPSLHLQIDTYNIAANDLKDKLWLENMKLRLCIVAILFVIALITWLSVCKGVKC